MATLIINDPSMTTSGWPKVLKTQYPTLNLDYVRPSQEWFHNSYEDMIGDKSSFGAMIRSNKAYNGLRHPMKEVNGLFKPDFNHRYLSEGLHI